MLRVYCDTNVFQILKPTHPSYSEELYRLFQILKEKFLFCFSDAHLDDLSSSKKEFRDRDLKLMEEYVRDNYYCYDHVKSKQFKCYLATPSEAFAGKDYDAAKKVLSTPFNVDDLFTDLGDAPETKMANNILKSYFDLPIAVFGNAIDTLIMDDKSQKWMNKIIPNYSPLMTMGDMINSILPFGAGLLEDAKEVTELRKYIGEYVNRETYSFEKWGLTFNQKFKETTFGKTYMEMIDAILTEKQKDDFYLRFSYTYSLLEMYNITQERKSGGGLKKFDYGSLNRDALHAYYASFCDFLVTDDKGLQVKANIVYQLFGFPTKVLSSRDFSNLRNQLIGQEETSEKLFETLKYDVKHSFQLYEKVDVASGSKINTFKTNHNYFNYFNRFQIIQDGSTKTLVLYCERKGHGNFVMYREIEVLVRKLIETLGVDDEKKGFYTFSENEIDASSDIIRKWVINNSMLSLVESYGENRGNFLCLCIDLNAK